MAGSSTRSSLSRGRERTPWTPIRDEDVPQRKAEEHGARGRAAYSQGRASLQRWGLLAQSMAYQGEMGRDGAEPQRDEGQDEPEQRAQSFGAGTTSKAASAPWESRSAGEELGPAAQRPRDGAAPCPGTWEKPSTLHGTIPPVASCKGPASTKPPLQTLQTAPIQLLQTAPNHPPSTEVALIYTDTPNTGDGTVPTCCWTSHLPFPPAPLQHCCPLPVPLIYSPTAHSLIRARAPLQMGNPHASLPQHPSPAQPQLLALHTVKKEPLCPAGICNFPVSPADT